MEQSPRSVLRIALLEVSKKGGVSKVLQARGIVSHDIGQPGKVEGGVTVAMFALMAAGEVAQVGRRAIRGDSAFAHPRDGGGVV